MNAISRDYLIVFTTNKRHCFGRYFRRAMSLTTLSKYIGEENANKAIKGRLNCEADKYIKKYRKHGRVEIYLK